MRAVWKEPTVTKGLTSSAAASFFDVWTAENATASWWGNRRVTAGIAVTGVLATAGGVAIAVVSPMSSASADPSADSWYRLRQCESSNTYSINTGNGYYGAYQFDLSTWRSVGGTGYPNRASKGEQDARALILYRKRGWQPWTCASILGLREDADARSGRTADITVPGGGNSGNGGSAGGSGTSAGVPPFPGGSYWYRFGDTSRHIKTFQDQMHKRGYFPVGTGEYGPNTRRMVKRLQRSNGLVPNGYIGPHTWRLAWTGTY